MKYYILIVIFIYGLPMWNFRYAFRSTVYREKGFMINIRPWFVQETLALFSNSYFKNKKEIAMANKYRLYMLGFVLLWTWFFLS
ncbi:MAG: hypothetical protein ACI83O_000547 [Patescibacteria group bacterium]|jgi:hypothetical protein